MKRLLSKGPFLFECVISKNVMTVSLLFLVDVGVSLLFLVVLLSFLEHSTKEEIAL